MSHRAPSSSAKNAKSSWLAGTTTTSKTIAKDSIAPKSAWAPTTSSTSKTSGAYGSGSVPATTASKFGPYSGGSISSSLGATSKYGASTSAKDSMAPKSAWTPTTSGAYGSGSAPASSANKFSGGSSASSLGAISKYGAANGSSAVPSKLLPYSSGSSATPTPKYGVSSANSSAVTRVGQSSVVPSSTVWAPKQTASATSSSSWASSANKNTSAIHKLDNASGFRQQITTSSNASAWSTASKTQTSSSSTIIGNSVNKFTTSSTASAKSATSTHYESSITHQPSSINKYILDKEEVLSAYKSPDRIGMSSSSIINPRLGSKYITSRRNPAPSQYNSIYNRTGVQGPLVAGGIGGTALATSAIGNNLLLPTTALSPTDNLPHVQNIKLSPLPTISTRPQTGSQQSLSTTLDAKPNPMTQAATKTAAVAPPKSKLLARLTAKPGYLVIFNQQEFKIPTVERRVGSNRDEEALCRVMHRFGFNPIVKRDLRLKDIEKEALHLRNKDFKNYECCVIVVLSHGHQNELIFAADGQFNLQTMLVDRVAMNKSLVGKAKIFIIAACKGDSEVSMKVLHTDATPFTPPVAKEQPYMRDTLKLYSTYEGYVSYRDPERGTVFVQELCRLLKEHGDTMHIEDILKKVIITLTERPTHQQVPSVTSTMSFNICFGDLKR